MDESLKHERLAYEHVEQAEGWLNRDGPMPADERERRAQRLERRATIEAILAVAAAVRDQTEPSL